jgi:hypothetical protein
VGGERDGPERNAPLGAAPIPLKSAWTFSRGAVLWGLLSVHETAPGNARVGLIPKRTGQTPSKEWSSQTRQLSVVGWWAEAHDGIGGVVTRKVPWMLGQPFGAHNHKRVDLEGLASTARGCD